MFPNTTLQIRQHKNEVTNTIVFTVIRDNKYDIANKTYTLCRNIKTCRNTTSQIRCSQIRHHKYDMPKYEVTNTIVLAVIRGRKYDIANTKFTPWRNKTCRNTTSKIRCSQIRHCKYDMHEYEVTNTIVFAVIRGRKYDIANTTFTLCRNKTCRNTTSQIRCSKIRHRKYDMHEYEVTNTIVFAIIRGRKYDIANKTFTLFSNKTCRNTTSQIRRSQIRHRKYDMHEYEVTNTIVFAVIRGRKYDIANTTFTLCRNS